jgi:hypothetical protein
MMNFRNFLEFSLSLGFEQNLVGNALRSCSQMKGNNMLQSYNENIAMIGLDSMQKANSTLEDFVSIYSKSNFYDMIMDSWYSAKMFITQRLIWKMCK